MSQTTNQPAVKCLPVKCLLKNGLSIHSAAEKSLDTNNLVVNRLATSQLRGSLICILITTAMLVVSIAAFLALPSKTASASAIKMNKTSASVLVANSFHLSVSGTKKTVKWSSSNSAVASVSNGKVVGKKPGKAVITAKVSGKSLKCSVTVKYNAVVAEKNITSKTKDLYNGILIQYKNKNKYPVSITATLRYHDAVKTVIAEVTDQNYCLEAGKSTWLYFPKATDGNGNYVKYSDYKTTIHTSASKYKGYTKDITQWCKSENSLMNMTAYNYSGKNLTAVRISCLLYDSNGCIVAYMSYFPACLQKDSHSEETLNPPSYISSPAKVETFVDYAY